MAKRKKQQEESILDILRLLLSGLSRTALVVIAVVAVLLVAGAAFVYWLLGSNNASVATKEHVELSPTQIERIKAIGQWEFLTVSDEELVDTVRHGFFGDDELARVYYGTLRLGFDMQQYKEEWLSVRGDTLIATLPPIGLVDDNFLDEARTRSFYESGKWSEEDRAALAEQAKAKMRQRCLSKANLASARKNARTQLWTMFHALGFKNIRIENK